MTFRFAEKLLRCLIHAALTRGLAQADKPHLSTLPPGPLNRSAGQLRCWPLCISVCKRLHLSSKAPPFAPLLPCSPCEFPDRSRQSGQSRHGLVKGARECAPFLLLGTSSNAMRCFSHSSSAMRLGTTVQRQRTVARSHDRASSDLRHGRRASHRPAPMRRPEPRTSPHRRR